MLLVVIWLGNFPSHGFLKEILRVGMNTYNCFLSNLWMQVLCTWIKILILSRCNLYPLFRVSSVFSVLRTFHKTRLKCDQYMSMSFHKHVTHGLLPIILFVLISLKPSADCNISLFDFILRFIFFVFNLRDWKRWTFLCKQETKMARRTEYPEYGAVREYHDDPYYG